MSTYTPDCWVVIRLRTQSTAIDKVLAGWYGGYANGDSWKLSSGIEHTEEFDDRYEFTNASGSLYVCYKQRERMSGYTSGVYSNFDADIAKHNAEHPDDLYSVEIIPYSK